MASGLAALPLQIETGLSSGPFHWPAARVHICWNQKSKFASCSSPLFRVRVPSPQNYPMVKRVSSNLVILVSLAQRQVFSWSSHTQGPNSQHQGAMIAGAQIWNFSNLLKTRIPIWQLKALLFTCPLLYILDWVNLLSQEIFSSLGDDQMDVAKYWCIVLV